MALLEVDFSSEMLMRTVTMKAILPVDRNFGRDYHGEPLKTLYLLHGAMGNCSAWVRETRIHRLAMEKNIAVIMPSADNSTYLDHENEHNFYGRFIGEELVEMTRKMFPLSHRREDTYIAGLSMGGYGALRNGLKYNEVFSYAAALSAGFRVEKAPYYGEEGPFFQTRTYSQYTYGDDLFAAVNSDKNPKFRARQLKEKGEILPELYVSCGTEDERLDDAKDFVEFLRSLGIGVTCDWGKGGHDWEFWDSQIEKVLQWLPD